MRAKTFLLIAFVACIVVAAAADTSLDKLKAKVMNGTAAAPCDKAAPAGPAPPRQYLDQRLPIVVSDYHPPAGGFNPTDIPDKEVDVAARKILREIQKAEAEAAANGDAPAAPAAGVEMSTEEHKAMKQLLLDADILVRAAGKMLAENGPIEEKKIKKIVKKVAKSAIKKAKKNLKKKNKKDAKKKAKAGKKLSKKPAKTLAKAPAPAPAKAPAKAAPKTEQKPKAPVAPAKGAAPAPAPAK